MFCFSDPGGGFGILVVAEHPEWHEQASKRRPRRRQEAPRGSSRGTEAQGGDADGPGTSPRALCGWGPGGRLAGLLGLHPLLGGFAPLKMYLF